MQQYFKIESGSGTLTVFHTRDSVGFDVEHYGGFEVSDEELLDFLTGDETRLTARKRVDRFSEGESFESGYIEKTDNGLVVYVDGMRSTTVRLTEGQRNCLVESITVGAVERYEDGQYPVEFVDRSGSRDRAEHNN